MNKGNSMKSTTAHEDQFSPDPTSAEEEAWREIEKRQSDGRTRVVPEYQTGGALTWEDSAPAQPKPVAWRCDWPSGHVQYHDADDLPDEWDEPPASIKPLYAAQAQPVVNQSLITEKPSLMEVRHLWGAATEHTGGDGLEAMQHFAGLVLARFCAQQPVSGADELPTIEQMAVNRYRPVPFGMISYKVVAGDGTRSLFSGTKDECQIVARKLTEAFLDGAHVALRAQPQPSGNAGKLSRDLLSRVSDALGRFVSDEGWSQADMDLSDEFAAALAKGGDQAATDAEELPQVVLPPRPEPLYKQGDYPSNCEVSCDCYAGVDVLAYGRACAEAQRTADRAALAAQASGQDREDVKEVIERLPRYNFGYVSDEWGMSRQLGAIQKDNGRFLRVDDVMAAIDHARRVEGEG